MLQMRRARQYCASSYVEVNRLGFRGDYLLKVKQSLQTSLQFVDNAVLRLWLTTFR